MGRRVGFLGLVNYRQHPGNDQYRIFSFNTTKEADAFEEELTKREIWFERDEEEIKGGTLYLFGVHHSDFKEAQQGNFAVSAKHREPIIKNKILRYGFVIFFFSSLTIAIIGYFKSQQLLEEKNKELIQTDLEPENETNN